MKLSAAFVLLGAASQAAAFAPQPLASSPVRVSTELEMAHGAKRAAARRVLKQVGKVAGAAASVTLATAGVPSSAVAWRQASKAAEVVETVDKSKKIVGLAFGAGTAAGIAAGIAAASVLEGIKGTPIKEMVDSIEKSFPGAQKNKALVKNIKSALSKYDYGKDSLVATSLCADEVNRVLEKDLGSAFDYNFHMGGLAGEFHVSCAAQEYPCQSSMFRCVLSGFVL